MINKIILFVFGKVKRFDTFRKYQGFLDFFRKDVFSLLALHEVAALPAQGPRPGGRAAWTAFFIAFSMPNTVGRRAGRQRPLGREGMQGGRTGEKACGWQGGRTGWGRRPRGQAGREAGRQMPATCQKTCPIPSSETLPKALPDIHQVRCQIDCQVRYQMLFQLPEGRIPNDGNDGQPLAKRQEHETVRPAVPVQ